MWERELQVAEQAARRAGAIIRDFYEHGVPVEYKDRARDNPVTAADTEADACIQELVRDNFPDDGWLSEETRDSHERLARRRVWIVDPLDGTKEFVQHIPELCVCIGLVEDGRAVLGVSYNPITDELFAGVRGRGLTVNGVGAHVSATAELAGARVLASRSENSRGEWDAFKPHVRVELTGSVAFKLALIGAGRSDGTFSLTPKHEWDICSGAALIEAGGGRITDCYGEPLLFNRAKPLLPGLIATNAALYEPIRELIARVAPPR